MLLPLRYHLSFVVCGLRWIYIYIVPHFPRAFSLSSFCLPLYLSPSSPHVCLYISWYLFILYVVIPICYTSHFTHTFPIYVVIPHLRWWWFIPGIYLVYILPFYFGEWVVNLEQLLALRFVDGLCYVTPTPYIHLFVFTTFCCCAFISSCILLLRSSLLPFVIYTSLVSLLLLWIIHFYILFTFVVTFTFLCIHGIVEWTVVVGMCLFTYTFIALLFHFILLTICISHFVPDRTFTLHGHFTFIFVVYHLHFTVDGWRSGAFHTTTLSVICYFAITYIPSFALFHLRWVGGVGVVGKWRTNFVVVVVTFSTFVVYSMLLLPSPTSFHLSFSTYLFYRLIICPHYRSHPHNFVAFPYTPHSPCCILFTFTTFIYIPIPTI